MTLAISAVVIIVGTVLFAADRLLGNTDMVSVGRHRKEKKNVFRF